MLSITLATGSEREERTRAQLLSLVERYRLGDWQFAEVVRIQEGVVPHSHPVLTLNTRHLDDDVLLLSTYLHEQLHWYAAGRYDAVGRAMEDLRAGYPWLGHRAAGEGLDEESAYLHVVVCCLESLALAGILGNSEARGVLEFWARDHDKAIYRLVLDDGEAIYQLLRRHCLVPGPHRQVCRE